MKANFKSSLNALLKHEGEYVDHPRDPGGATNMGVTRATLAAWRGVKLRDVPKSEVKNLTREEAGQIYKARYWDTVKADKLPSGVDYAVFDGSVNSGPRQAIKWLQSAVGVKRDGRLGITTMGAVQSAPAKQTVATMLTMRLAWLKKLKHWPTFGKGWSNRIRGVRKKALRMARTQAQPPPPDIPKPDPVVPKLSWMATLIKLMLNWRK
ncbi:MAG: glycoside hydrolase family 108 protein [Gammaproteobacteria bacterium]|nr:glycoside hydrolase family 108 protein [Gammaproteobacteria bacterium]